MNIIDLAIITGAGRGIGKAIALELGKKDISVLCISKTKNCHFTRDEIRKKGGKAFSLEIDITNYTGVANELGEWISHNNGFHKIGFVFAASILGEKTDFNYLNIDDWLGVMQVNLLGNLAVYNAFLPTVLHNKFGRFLFFAGGGSAYEYPLFAAYSASKTAVVRTAENLHEMLKNKGDFATVVLAPGAIETDMLKKVKAAGAEIRTTLDISEPVKFANHFLNSEKCNFSGRFLHVKDDWKEYLNNNNELPNKDVWKLRRIEK